MKYLQLQKDLSAPKWELKKLIWVHLIILLLALSYLTPLTFSWISWVDIKCAYLFNSHLAKGLFWHRFWNFFRSSKATSFYDFVILGFALYYIFTGEKSYLKKTIKCLILVLFSMAIFAELNHGLLHEILRPLRTSPLGSLPEFIPLSARITGKAMKGFTNHSFPSDFACKISIFVFSTFFLRGWRFALMAFLSSLPLLLARLVVGTHWLSDITFGSIPITLFFLSWLFYSPLFSILSEIFIRGNKKVFLKILE